MKDVSLLVPCFNGARFLPRLMASARQQTQPFAEIMLYDDASTDDSVAVARKLGFTVIPGAENRGCSFARNQLIDAARTPFIHFHDADDDLEPQFVERLLPHCSGDTAAFCVTIVIRDGKQMRLNDLPVDGHDPVEFLIRRFIHLNAVIYPREFVARGRRFDTRLANAEDKAFHIALAHQGLRFHFVNEPLTYWVRNRESTLANMGQARSYMNLLRCYEFAREYLPARYHRALGEEALDKAWHLYYNNFSAEARHALRFARSCGVTTWRNAGRASALVSKMLGVRSAFFLRKQWSRVRSPVGRSPVSQV